MPTYVLAHIHHTTIGPDIVDYVEHIEATMAPFGGRHIVHGGLTTVLEGEWPGDTVILEFPDRARAEAWYASDAYQRILPLRTANTEGSVIIVDGVPSGYRATDLLVTRA